MFYSRAEQIALAIAIIATQDSAEIVSRIGHRHTLWPVIASMAFPQPDPISRTTFKPLHA